MATCTTLLVGEFPCKNDALAFIERRGKAGSRRYAVARTSVFAVLRRGQADQARNAASASQGRRSHGAQVLTVSSTLKP